jgi:hypothetical protein
MRRRRVALLTALGVDNFGSGLFLPVTLVYVTRVVGLPLAVAGVGLLFASRANALAEAAAPAGSRGRYLAAFQYAFTVPGVIAPAVVALFGVAVWLPWLLVAASAGLAVVALRVVARHLPAYALRPPVARRPPRLQSIGSRLPGN